MAAYKDLVGQKITKVTSNPSEPKTGQMWYNSTAGKLRGMGITTAWVTAGTYFNKIFGTAVGGPVNAALGAGGYGPPGPSNQDAGGEYNGTGWSSIPTLGTARGNLGASKQGSQSAFWVAGGSSQTGKTEEFNGTTWSEDGDLSTGRRLGGTAGTLTAGLAFGGYASPSGTNSTEEYNGTSWTAGGNLGASLYYNTGFGTQTAAISACGNTGSPDTGVNNAYQYDGSSWTTLSNVSYSQQQGGGHGNTSEGFVYGGSGPPSTYLNTTSEWDGSSWTTIPQTLPSPSRAWNGTGPGTNGLNLGGSSPTLPNGTTNTNEFTRSTNTITAAAWASGGNLNTARRAGAGFGTQTAGAVAAGNQNAPGYSGTANSEEYDGTSFTEGNNVNTARSNTWGYGPQTAGNVIAGGSPNAVNNYETYDGTDYSNGPTLNQARFGLAGCGTQTAGLAFGGYYDPGGTNGANQSEEYDGSSWAEGNNLNTGRYDVVGFGIQTAAVAAGGITTAAVTNVEEYDGTSWTNATALANPQRAGNAACGTQTAGLIFGGLVGPSEAKSGLTQGYDGTSWSTRPSMATSRIQMSPAHAGSSTSTFAAGGNILNPTTNATEEFTGETTAANIADFTTS
jgi:hypothetical protein